MCHALRYSGRAKRLHRYMTVCEASEGMTFGFRTALIIAAEVNKFRVFRVLIRCFLGPLCYRDSTLQASCWLVK